MPEDNKKQNTSPFRLLSLIIRLLSLIIFGSITAYSLWDVVHQPETEKIIKAALYSTGLICAVLLEVFPQFRSTKVFRIMVLFLILIALPFLFYAVYITCIYVPDVYVYAVETGVIDIIWLPLCLVFLAVAYYWFDNYWLTNKRD